MLLSSCVKEQGEDSSPGVDQTVKILEDLIPVSDETLKTMRESEALFRAGTVVLNPVAMSASVAAAGDLSLWEEVVPPIKGCVRELIARIFAQGRDFFRKLGGRQQDARVVSKTLDGIRKLVAKVRQQDARVVFEVHAPNSILRQEEYAVAEILEYVLASLSLSHQRPYVLDQQLHGEQQVTGGVVTVKNKVVGNGFFSEDKMELLRKKFKGRWSPCVAQTVVPVRNKEENINSFTPASVRADPLAALAKCVDASLVYEAFRQTDLAKAFFSERVQNNSLESALENFFPPEELSRVREYVNLFAGVRRNGGESFFGFMTQQHGGVDSPVQMSAGAKTNVGRFLPERAGVLEPALEFPTQTLDFAADNLNVLLSTAVLREEGGKLSDRAAEFEARVVGEERRWEGLVLKMETATAALANAGEELKNLPKAANGPMHEWSSRPGSSEDDPQDAEIALALDQTIATIITRIFETQKRFQRILASASTKRQEVQQGRQALKKISQRADQAFQHAKRRAQTALEHNLQQPLARVSATLEKVGLRELGGSASGGLLASVADSVEGFANEITVLGRRVRGGGGGEDAPCLAESPPAASCGARAEDSCPMAVETPAGPGGKKAPSKKKKQKSSGTAAAEAAPVAASATAPAAGAIDHDAPNKCDEDYSEVFPPQAAALLLQGPPSDAERRELLDLSLDIHQLLYGAKTKFHTPVVGFLKGTLVSPPSLEDRYGALRKRAQVGCYAVTK